MVLGIFCTHQYVHVYTHIIYVYIYIYIYIEWASALVPPTPFLIGLKDWQEGCETADEAAELVWARKTSMHD